VTAAEVTGLPVVDAAVAEQVARDTPGVSLLSEPSPKMTAIAGQFAARARAGTLRRCPHLSPGEVAHWLAWSPGRLQCLACFLAAMQRIAGTNEATSCDGCRRQVPDEAPGAPGLHSVALALETAVLYAGLCPECRSDGRTATKEDA
jgi:hypothetical protein